MEVPPQGNQALTPEMFQSLRNDSINIITTEKKEKKKS